MIFSGATAVVSLIEYGYMTLGEYTRLYFLSKTIWEYNCLAGIFDTMRYKLRRELRTAQVLRIINDT